MTIVYGLLQVIGHPQTLGSMRTSFGYPHSPGPPGRRLGGLGLPPFTTVLWLCLWFVTERREESRKLDEAGAKTSGVLFENSEIYTSLGATCMGADPESLASPLRSGSRGTFQLRLHWKALCISYTSFLFS